MVLPSESFHRTVLGMGTCAIAVTVVASRIAMTNFMAHHSCFQFCIEIDERLLDILSRCRRFRPRWREGPCMMMWWHMIKNNKEYSLCDKELAPVFADAPT